MPGVGDLSVRGMDVIGTSPRQIALRSRSTVHVPDVDDASAGTGLVPSSSASDVSPKRRRPAQPSRRLVAPPQVSSDPSRGRGGTRAEMTRTLQVLLTEESLRPNPRVTCRQGRPRAQHRPGRENPVCDGPPSLAISGVVEGRSASMTPLFRMYADASLKQATLSATRVSHELDHRDGSVTESGDEGGEEEEEAIDPLEDQEGGPVLDLVDRNQVLHNFKEWPLYWDRPIDFQEACEVMLNVRRIDASKICASVPQDFRGEGTFVIDLRNFDNRHDVARDGLGMWGKPTGRTRFYSLTADGRPVRVDDGKGKIAYGEHYEYKCMAKRYEHRAMENTGSRFIKKVELKGYGEEGRWQIFTAVHPPIRGTAIALAVVCYEWIGARIPFEIPSHRVGPRRAPSSQPVDGSRSWEAASFAVAGVREDDLCNAVFQDCPVYALGAVDFGAAAVIILGGTHIDAFRICTRVPQGYRESGTFVIDIGNFVTDAELRRDGNGAWGKPAGHSRYYKIDAATGDAVRVDRGHKLIEGSDYDVQILNKRYEHTAVGGRFVRKIYTGRSRCASAGRGAVSCSNLAVITYYWKGEPEYFEATPQRRVRIAERAAAAYNESLRLTASTTDASGIARGNDEGDEEDVLYEEVDEEEGDRDAAEGNHHNGGREQAKTGGQQRERIVTTVDQLPGASSSTVSPRGMSVQRVVRRPTIGSCDQRASPNTGPTTTEQLRTIVYKKEYENQQRFSTILDRAESLLDRLERVGHLLPEHLWLANDSANTMVVEQVVHDGEFVHGDDGNTYII